MTPASLCTNEHFVIHNKIVFTVYRKTVKSRAFAQLIITIPIPKIMQTLWVLCVWHSVHCALCACVEVCAQANKELSAVSFSFSPSLFLSRNSIRSHDAQIQIIFGSLLLLNFKIVSLLQNPIVPDTKRTRLLWAINRLNRCAINNDMMHESNNRLFAKINNTLYLYSCVLWTWTYIIENSDRYSA